MSEKTTQVIVVEDEPQIRRFVCAALRKENCHAVEAATAQAGLEAAARNEASLVILDLGLPDRDGISFIRDLRTWSQIPVLILSARVSEQDKIAALDAGADDYLVKPFGVGELLARTRALLRRRARQAGTAAVHRFGGAGAEIEVDLSRRRVSRSGVEVHLTQTEYQLLAVMLANEGKVMTHRHLMREIWDSAGQAHTLRVYVGRLRQKLEANATQPQHFLTETGVGYRFQP